MTSNSLQARIAFGLFEADLTSGELYKAGFRVKLQSQPFRVLMALVERPGEVVTREELQLRLWGKDTTVDFDHSLGTAINKIREALGDSAENPRFVETLAKRGYRFIAPVTLPPNSVSQETPEVLPAASPTPTSTDVPPFYPPTMIEASPTGAHGISPGEILSRRIQTRYLLAGGVALVVVIAGAFFLGAGREQVLVPKLRQITHDGHILPGSRAMEAFPAVVTDGVHLFTSDVQEGKVELVQISTVSGDAKPLGIPDEVMGPSVGDISPDGSRLLIRSHLSNESEQPLWMVPVGGGSAQRVPNVLAHDATWMPNGEDVLFAAEEKLFVAHLKDRSIEEMAKLPGRAFWLRWSSDGKRLRFTIFDPITHTQALWQLDAGSASPKPLLKGWKEDADTCCGVWTADGSSFIFQAMHGNESDLWRMGGHGVGTPQRLTDGPMVFQGAVAARTGTRIFFTGVDVQSDVEIYRPQSKDFGPVQSFLRDAHRLEFSRDRQWVAWADTNGRLWRARIDGSEKLQLTPDAIQVFLVRWSPDGNRLALMGRETGKAWQIYLVKADGSALERVLQESRNAGDPTWSPDGKSLAFGRVPDLMGKEEEARMVQIVDLDTRAVQTLPGSENLFSPRWSPDGRHIAAISLDQRRLMLYDTATHQWRQLAYGSFADPVWTSDNQAIIAHGFMDSRQPIVRVAVQDGRVEELATLSNFHAGSIMDFFFCGLTPDNLAVVRAQRATGNLYSLDTGAH
ncbi:winged helix-turn-helix domain-containing protein [Terriglobus saanensis]|uniref:Transcriptional regulator, CadC n=1 Tax=Terriglobus saanensis (strain ATCC BAA-1853 / DSM 23119 / SP1PR4) TaxID=401053 RepID=E8V2Q4_TERSS|nr:winged helix-turn-helix domain-containing protein [Terriglobus saanensis]ADV83529.1 transcriptional regulator, CadC [Terriglobus saanensis SP1PR4]